MEQPPFVLSRESKIRIDRDGHVWHEGERVMHGGLERGLASWVDVDESTGRYILRNALDWCFVTVDDAPLVVRAAHVRPTGVTLTLSDGSTEPLDAHSLRIDPEGVPYCDVRDGRLPARFDRTAAFTLLENARSDGDRYLLAVGELEIPVLSVEHAAARARKVDRAGPTL